MPEAVSPPPSNALRDAATVLLLRPAADGGVEVFIQVRRRSMAFAAGAAVFPGGGVDSSDAVGTEGWDRNLPTGPLRDPHENGAAIVAAAIRETFEECGVLLAAPRGTSRDGSGAPSARPGSGEREELEAHRAGISEVLGRFGLVPELAAVSLVDRWVTPEGEGRRYDTRFLAAVLPEGAVADGENTESVESFWIRPADALQRFARGELALMPPTWAQLDRLSHATTPEDGLVPVHAEPTRPTIERSPDGPVARFWGTEAYLAARRGAHG